MSNKELTVKNSLEMVVAMGTAAVIIKKIAKDGIGMEDLVHIKAIADSMPVMTEAVADADMILEELKNLDQAEVIQIIGELYNQAKLLNKA